MQSIRISNGYTNMFVCTKSSRSLIESFHPFYSMRQINRSIWCVVRHVIISCFLCFFLLFFNFNLVLLQLFTLQRISRSQPAQHNKSMFVLKSTRCKIINLVHDLNQKYHFILLYVRCAVFSLSRTHLPLIALNANALFSISL